jgi:heme/copper-type cytochrome/quinol oxidase subunit 1
MPRRVADYSPAYGWGGWNTVSTVGAGIVALSVVVFIVNVALTSIAGRPAGADPWEAHTLEWATTSPPPRHNFTAALPAIRSPAPLLDLREEAIL